MELRNVALPAIIGLGLYAQSNNINLANNTTTLLTLGLLLTQQQELTRQRIELERANLAVFGTNTTSCGMTSPIYSTPLNPAQFVPAPYRYGM